MKIVCIQGLGFVGSAMAVAVASAKNSSGRPLFKVIGVDLDNSVGHKKINSINSGKFPFPTLDDSLLKKTLEAFQNKNLFATADPSVYGEADYIIVNLPFDASFLTEAKERESFINAIRTFASLMKQECLIIVETTVPPGTCRKIILPVIEEEFDRRNLLYNNINLAHSYERVMPGKYYLDSIVNFYRCYAGLNEQSAILCEYFLSQIINVKEWPLTKLKTLESSEIAKILENSYRATTIAFMEEWSEFAEALNVDLYEIIDAIKMRPTHSNMRQPGFGVGGYCLTKDPLFASLSCQEILNLKNLSFPFSGLAITTNQKMPLRNLEKLENILGTLKNKKLLLLGVSYRQDIGDTRYSPARAFFTEVMLRGGEAVCHDPLVSYWEEMQLAINSDINTLKLQEFDAVVIAVPHQTYRSADFINWLRSYSDKPMVIFDACHILNESTIKALKNNKHTVYVIGRGIA